MVQRAPSPQARTPEEVLSQLVVLRSRGDYSSAARELELALEEPHSSSTRERFSFELGTILFHHLHDSARACERWGKHQAQFPGGRYAMQIVELQTQAGCSTR
jgi:hypothetical protein